MPARQPRAHNVALRPDPAPTLPPELARAHEALAEAALVVASFRWRLRSAGYPFREPPAVDGLIARIDSILYPEEAKRA
jgi:hypothetical protein